jgi:hypothetical protein
MSSAIGSQQSPKHGLVAGLSAFPVNDDQEAMLYDDLSDPGCGR